MARNDDSRYNCGIADKKKDAIVVYDFGQVRKQTWASDLTVNVMMVFILGLRRLLVIVGLFHQVF